MAKIYNPTKQTKTPIKNRRVNTMLYYSKRDSEQCKSASNQSRHKKAITGTKTIESSETYHEIPNPLPRSMNYRHNNDMIFQKPSMQNRSIYQSEKNISKSKIYEFNVNHSKIFEDKNREGGRNYKQASMLTEAKLEKSNVDANTSRAHKNTEQNSKSIEGLEIEKGIKRTKPITERAIINDKEEVLEKKYLKVYGEPNIFNIIGIKHSGNKYKIIKFVLFNIETELNLEIGTIILNEPEEYNKISVELTPILHTNNYEEILQAITQIKGFKIDPGLLERMKEESEATSELEPIKSQYSMEDEN